MIGKTCLIHSVDSIKLAKEIEKESEKNNLVTNILLEVNVAREESKSVFFRRGGRSTLFGWTITPYQGVWTHDNSSFCS